MSYYETNKKDDSTQPFTNRRATTRLSRFFLAPQCSRGQSSSAEAMFTAAEPPTRLGLLRYSQSLSLVNTGSGTSLPTTGSSVTCLSFYSGGDGATTGHPVLKGTYNMLFGIQFVILYIHQSFKNSIHSNTKENNWKLLWLAPLSRRPSSSDVGLELLAKAKP